MAQKKKIRGKGLISKLKTTKKKINQGLRSIGIKTQRKTYVHRNQLTGRGILRAKQGKQPLSTRLIALLMYSIMYSQTLASYYPMLSFYCPQIMKSPLLLYNPILTFQRILNWTNSEAIAISVYHRLFIRRTGGIFKIPYFARHHLTASLLLSSIMPCLRIGVEFFFQPTSIVGSNTLQIISLCGYSLLQLMGIPFALGGYYIQIPRFEVAIENWAGDFKQGEVEEIDFNGKVIDENPQVPIGGLYGTIFDDFYKKTDPYQQVRIDYYLDSDMKDLDEIDEALQEELDDDDDNEK